MLIDVLKSLDFSEKEIKVYLALLVKGQASVRTISTKTKIGRGTVYNILKKFKDKEFVGISEKGKLKYFSARDPEKILNDFEEKEKELEKAKAHFKDILPELKDLFSEGSGKPRVSYYTGRSGIKSVLQDILFIMGKSKDKLVYLYSSVELRGPVYEAFPEYTRLRIDAGIQTRVIKMGKGGYLRGLDEAKFMAVDKQNRTYTYIYENKIAYITSKPSGYVMCAIIEEENIARTHKFLFEALWEYLPNTNIPAKKSDF